MLERGTLPEKASPVGADLGPLTSEAAATLGLTTACRVGAGLIDAYAGALGVLGGFARDLERHRPASGADRRHVELRDGLFGGAAILRRRLGTLLRRRTSRTAG